MTTKDFLGIEWEIDCMGCAIGDGSMSPPSGFIRVSKHFCVHQDPLIPLPGFLVIASLRHIQSIGEMGAEEYAEFAGLVRAAHCAIKRATVVERLTLVQEESSRHFHLWFFPWTQEVIEIYGRPSLSKIREIMSDLREATLDDRAWIELEASIEDIRRYWPES